MIDVLLRDVLWNDSFRGRVRKRLFVDRFIENVAGTQVPMLRVSDSLAIAEHALGLGLLADASLDDIAKEVQRDRTRPTLPEAAADEAKEKVATGDVSQPGAS